MTITVEQLEHWFKYHDSAEKVPQYTAINNAALEFAKVVVANSPSSADQTSAIRHIRDARMTANAAVACDGR